MMGDFTFDAGCQKGQAAVNKSNKKVTYDDSAPATKPSA